MSQLLSEETRLLGDTLSAFSYAHSLGHHWATTHLVYFKRAGIDSMIDLTSATLTGTLNLDLDFVGDVPPEDRLSDETILLLKNFLPGPIGLRCFRLAQKAAEKVEKGTADAKYVHRPQNGKRGNEKWVTDGKDWKLHVDCAGFVRSVLKHVLSNIHSNTDISMPVALSDRCFMRAKDFYRYFESIELSVTDTDVNFGMSPKWRLIRDLRMVVPGDIIVYRPKGNAAGGAAFTKNDRSSLKHVLRAVKTAQLWKAEDQDGKVLVTRNVGRDPQIRPWVDAVLQKLAAMDIGTVKELKANLDKLSKEQGEDDALLTADTLQLMKECCETTALNTGHIVFAAGPAELKENGEYRIRVVHSTKHGKKDIVSGETMQGVQLHYRRFRLLEGKWTRGVRVPVVVQEETAETDDEELVEGDDEVNDDVADPIEENASDDLAGQTNVDVLAARMAF